MYGQYPLYTFLLTASATALAGLALYVWQRRPAPGAAPFALLLAGVVEWSLSNALEMASTSLTAKVFWGNMQFFGIVVVPSSWLVFTLQYTGRERWLPRFYPLLLLIEPIATVVITWTNESHHLMRERWWLETLGPATVLVVEFGSFFWTHAAYSYLLLLVGSLLFVPYIFRATFLYRGQASTVLAGAFMPWLSNFLYLSGLSPLPYLDLTPPAFILMGAAITWGLFRFRLLDVVPGARSAIVDGLADGVLVVGPRDRILDANPAALRIAGRHQDDLIGTTLTEAFATLPTLRARLAGEETESNEFTIEVDGQKRVYELYLSELFQNNSTPSGRLIALRDITERKRAEEELIQAGRLRAAGELSLGVSHNLNNILTGIIGPASALAERSENDRETRQQLQAILTSAERARDLVQRLGQTARDRESQLQPVAVNQIAEEAIRGAQPRWQDEAQAAGRSIEVVTDWGEVPPATANRAEFYDALLNLLINAIDALPEGGRIEVRSRTKDDTVILQIADNGIGMDDETRQRLFEPFFTTKVHVGTGLGLSTAYTAVQHWGGQIEVESTLGVGTTFTLLLPIWRGPLPEEPSEKTAASTDTSPIGHAHILVAEDEAIIAMMLLSQLRKEGHQPEHAQNGDEARALFATGRFQLAILDLGMPGVPGDQLAREFHAVDPHLVTILATGWKLESSDPRRQAADLYLQKPFATTRIQQVVAAALILHADRITSTQ